MPIREGLRGDFLCFRKVQRASGPVEVSLCILAFSLVLTAYLSNSVVSGKSHFFYFQGRVVLRTVSVMGWLEPCSARMAADRQTHTQTKYHKPSCTFVPRVNEKRVCLHVRNITRAIAHSRYTFTPYFYY